jgi:hypothetical protein
MLLPALKLLFLPVSLIYLLTIWGVTGFSYLANAKRKTDDPLKRDFHPLAILIAPFTLPLFAVGLIVLMIVKAFLYGAILIILTVLLIFYRKPTSPTWLEELITKIGNALLEANTLLIRLFLRPLAGRPI